MNGLPRPASLVVVWSVQARSAFVSRGCDVGTRDVSVLGRRGAVLRLLADGGDHSASFAPFGGSR